MKKVIREALAMAAFNRRRRGRPRVHPAPAPKVQLEEISDKEVEAAQTWAARETQDPEWQTAFELLFPKRVRKAVRKVRDRRLIEYFSKRV